MLLILVHNVVRETSENAPIGREQCWTEEKIQNTNCYASLIEAIQQLLCFTETNDSKKQLLCFTERNYSKTLFPAL